MNIHQRQIGARARTQLSQPSLTAFLSNAEVIVALLILIFPAMGTFFAPESYFAPQDFSGTGQDSTEVGFPFGRLAFVIIILWEFYLFVKIPRTMINGVKKAIVPLLYVCWSITTGFWAADPNQSINRSFRVLILCVFVAYVTERFDQRQILRLLAISGAVAICASIFAAIALPQYGLTTLIGYEGAWRGATGHKNTLGALMVAIFTASWFAYRNRVIDKRLALLLLLGSPFLIVMARSAGALITLILSIGLIFFFTFTSRLRRPVEKFFTLGLGVFCLCLLYVAQSLLDLFLGALGRSSDFTGRSEVWEVTWNLIKQRPFFGYGSGFWDSDSPDRAYAWKTLGWAPPNAHDNFLDLWLQLGLPGLIIMCSILAILVFRTATMIFHGAKPGSFLWPILAIAIIFGGLTETNLVENSGGIFWITFSYIMISKLANHRQTMQTKVS